MLLEEDPWNPRKSVYRLKCLSRLKYNVLHCNEALLHARTAPSEREMALLIAISGQHGWDFGDVGILGKETIQ